VADDQDHWFEPIAEHLGPAYLRYSFTKGTEQEVAFLIDALGLQPGQRVLDVGCGPGRHAWALASAGVTVHGIDISERFVALARAGAPEGATFERLDARRLPFDAEFDAAISLCQGAFGLSGGPVVPQAGGPGVPQAGGPGVPQAGGPVMVTPATIEPDEVVLAGMARALRPGAPLAVSAFSAYFQVRYLEAGDRFDAATGVNHEDTTVKDASGLDAPAELWTTCFTPRELRLLARAVGLVPEEIWSVTPGAYAAEPPDLDHPELLLIARKPL
jgi:SAM-dependent methyltransferase